MLSPSITLLNSQTLSLHIHKRKRRKTGKSKARKRGRDRSDISWLNDQFGDGQGGLACCDSWGRKESDTTERLNWTATEQLANCGSWNSSASVMVGPMPYNKLLSLSVCLYIYIYCVCVRAHHTPLIHNTNTFTYSHIPPLQVLCLWRTLTNTLNLYCFQHFYF